MQFSSVQANPPTNNSIHFYGSEATLHLNLDTNQLLISSKSNIEWKIVEIAKEDEESWRVEEEFVNAIKKQEKIKLTTFEDGFKYMVAIPKIQIKQIQIQI